MNRSRSVGLLVCTRAADRSAVLRDRGAPARRTAPAKLPAVDVGHGIQVTFDCVERRRADGALDRDVLFIAAGRCADRVGRAHTRRPVDVDPRTAGRRGRLGLRRHTTAWPFALAYPCGRKAQARVSVSHSRATTGRDRRIAPLPVDLARRQRDPPPVAAAAVGMDSGNGDPTAGRRVGPSNMGQAGCFAGRRIPPAAHRGPTRRRGGSRGARPRRGRALRRGGPGARPDVRPAGRRVVGRPGRHGAAADGERRRAQQPRGLERRQLHARAARLPSTDAPVSTPSTTSSALKGSGLGRTA